MARFWLITTSHNHHEYFTSAILNPGSSRLLRFAIEFLHHALINHVGPVVDSCLVDDTFACREGKGITAAVRRVQQHVRRFDWYVQMDVRQYFASIDHAILKQMLRQCVKGMGVLRLMDQIIDGNGDLNGRGLPIGALTSQVFANYYLSRVDRQLLRHPASRGYVRYMDDIIVWCDNRNAARDLHHLAKTILNRELGLELKKEGQINRTSHGVSFCGFRVFPGTIRLASSRKRRFLAKLDQRHRQYAAGSLSSSKLQSTYDALFGIECLADIRGWRAIHLRHRNCPS